MYVLQIPSMLLKGNSKLKTLIHSPTGSLVSSVSVSAEQRCSCLILLFCLRCCQRVSYRQAFWPGIPAVGTVLRQCVSPFHPSLQISQLKTARLACSGVFGLLEKRKGAISYRKGKKIFLKKKTHKKQSVPDWFSFSKVRTRRDIPATECVKP